MVWASRPKGQHLFVAHYDTHVHWRRLPNKKHLLQTAAVRMSGASEEPNTHPHLQTYDDVARSLEECHRIAPSRAWKSSIYLTPETKWEEVHRAWLAGLITHVKRYPDGGSTHSNESVPIELVLDRESPTGHLLRNMADARIPLKSHGEVVIWKGEELDPYDREEVYFREIAPRVDDLYPNLRQIHAHISTREAVKYMIARGNARRKVAEITGHHAMFDRRICFDGGSFLVDHHCLPPVKRAEHTLALQTLIREQPSFLMAGSDAAAHTTDAKYQCCAYGGFYTYHCSLELYLQVLEELGVLETYAGAFLYGNAKTFFGDLLPNDPHLIEVKREKWQVLEREHGAHGVEFTPFGFHPNAQRRHTFTWNVVT